MGDTPKLIGVTAFGKHPGWNDHIEPVLGSDTPETGQLQTELYRQGIYENVPLWERLEQEGSSMLPFDHKLITLITDGFIIARLWRSSDGRGRSVFPFVLAAQFSGPPTKGTLASTFAALDEIGAACQAETEGEAVARIVGDAYARVASVPPEPGGSMQGRLDEQLRDWIDALSADDYRALAGPLKKLAKACEGRSPDGEQAPGFVRLPLKNIELLAPLACLFSGQVPAGRGAFLAGPVGGEHVDLIVRPTLAVDWRGLRLPLGMSPLTSSESSAEERQTLVRNLEDLRFTGNLEGLLLPPPLPERMDSGSAILKAVESVRENTRDFIDEAKEQRKQLPIKKILIVSGAVISLFVGLTFFVNFRAEQARKAAIEAEMREFSPEDRAAWESLCLAYYSWFGAFLSYQGEHSDELKLWQADPGIGPALKAIASANHVMDPLAIAKSDKGYRSLMDTPPQEAKTKDGVETTAKSLALLQTLEAALTARREGIIKAVKATHADFETRSWSVALTTEAKLKRISKAEALGVKTGEHVSHLLLINSKIATIAESWETVGSLRDRASKIEAPLVKQLPDFIAAELKSANNLATLQAALDQLTAETSPLAQNAAFADEVWPQVDQEAFAAAEGAPTPSVNAKSILAWLDRAASYRRLQPGEDPRPDSEAFVALLADSLARLKVLASHPKYAALQADKTKLEAAHKSLLSQPAVVRHRDAISAGLNALTNEQIPAFADSIARAETNGTSAADWCSETTSQKFPTAAPLQAVWDARLDQPCATLHADLQAYAKAYKEVAVVAARLNPIDQRLQPLARSREWMPEPLLSELNDRLNALAESALKDPTWQQNTTWSENYDDAQAWSKANQNKLATLAKLEGAIAQAYLPDEKPPGASHSIAATVTTLGDANFTPLLAPIKALLDQVTKLRATDSIADLLSACQGKKEPIILRAAWQQLVTQTSALADDKLATVEAAAASIRAQLRALPEARRDALDTEVAHQLANVQNNFLVREIRPVVKAMKTAVSAFAEDYGAIKKDQLVEFEATASSLQANFDSQVAKAATGGVKVGEILRSVRDKAVLLQTQVKQARDPNFWLKEIEKLLDAGHALNAGIGDLYKNWEALLVKPSADLRSVVDRVERLKKIENSEPREALAIWRATTGPSPATAAATWRALQVDGWPASLAEVTQEFNLRKAVARLVPADELSKTLQDRWHALVKAIPAPQLPFDRIGDFGITPEEFGPKATLAYILWQERKVDLTGMTDNDVLKRRDALVAKLRRAVAAPPADLLRELQALTKDERANSAPTSAGPMTAGFAAAIKLVSDPNDSSRVDYEWHAATQTFSLSFLRVDPEAPDQPSFFLARHELSLGLAAALLDLADANTQEVFFEDLADQTIMVWQQTASNQLRLSDNWLVIGDPEIAYAQPPPKPARDTPMQHLDIAAAVYLANLIGCRLPSVDEWRQALRLTPNALRGANLRDASWKRFRDHLSQSPLPQKNVQWKWPVEGCAQFSDIAADLSPAIQTDDDHIYFASVTEQTNRGFCHLIGNVAEFVTGSPLVPVLPANLTAIRNKELVPNFIGGSAFSPAKPGPEAVGTLDIPRASDLGLRLAFTAPEIPLRLAYQRLISKSGTE